MKFKMRQSLTLFLSVCLLAGCGKVQTDNSAPVPSSSAGTGVTSSSDMEKSNEDFLNQEEEADPTPVPIKASLSFRETYSDNGRAVSVLGLKEYKKLTGDFGIDKPGKGNRFLVLFLEIENYGEEKDYINPYQVTASVDGRKIENTALVNRPEDYPTIFANIEAGMKARGFIVWRVPQKWKKFEFTYTGWDGSDGLTLAASFSPKDLKSPKQY